MQRIDDALARAALVYLHAPAGYGKSLVLDALVRAHTAIARYDAAPWERTAFVEPLVEAVRVVRPDFGRRAVALAATEPDVRRVGAAFGRELGHVDAPLVIAIDDAHVLDASFASFVQGVLHAAPANARFVVASRHAPPPALADAFATEHALAFGPDAFRFSDDEVDALARALGTAVDAGLRASLLKRTDGWPAAIALALRTGERVPANGALAPLVERLLGDLPGDDRLVLERWFVHETVADAMIDGVARAVLDRLVREGALVTRAGNGYRLHPLVREAVAERVARDEGVARVHALHAEAARWYDAQDRLGAALYHLTEAADAPLARELLRRRGADAIAAGHGAAVTAALASVGPEALSDPALIAYLTGWRLKLEGSVYAKDRFVEAGIVAREGDDERLTFATDVQLIELDLARGRTVAAEVADALVERGRLLGPAMHADAEIRAGWAAALRHEFEAALAFTERARLLGAGGHREDAVPLRAYALTVLGRFTEANDELVALIEALHDTDALVARTRMLGWSTRIASLQAERESALADASEAWRLGADLAPRAERASLALAYADAALEAGLLDDVERALDVTRRHIDAAWYGRDRARFPGLVHLLALRLAYARDGAAAALRIEHAGLGGTVADVAAYAERLAYATLAHAPLPDAFAPSSPLIADAADAVLYADALRVLRALDRDPRFDETPLRPYAQLLARRGTAGFVDRLIAALRTAPAPSPARPASLDPLTPREREILALLAEGLTNKEIAQRLVLGTRTVETHVARILGKLGVPSRSRAIAAYLRNPTDA